MWVFFENGTFYSAVNDNMDDNVKWVRSRDKYSSDVFAAWLRSQRKGRKAEVLQWEKVDYAYRVKATADEWLDYVAEQTDNAKATNFKSEVARNLGNNSRFLHALHNVWWDMNDYQNEGKK